MNKIEFEKPLKQKKIMKNMLKIIAIGAFTFMISSGVSLAQNPTTPPTGTEMPNAGKMNKNLTDEQKAMIKTAQEARKASRDEFKLTLTDEQKAILANKEITAQQRHDLFKASMTSAQLAMQEANKAAQEAFKDAMKASLTDEQKMKRQDMKEKNQERMKNLTDEQKAKMKEGMEKRKMKMKNH